MHLKNASVLLTLLLAAAVIAFAVSGAQFLLALVAVVFIVYLVTLRIIAGLDRRAFLIAIQVGYVAAIATAGLLADIVIAGVPASGTHARYINLGCVVSLVGGVALSITKGREMRQVPDPWNDPVHVSGRIASLLSAAVWPMTIVVCVPMVVETLMEHPLFGMIQTALFVAVACGLSVGLSRLERRAQKDS